MNSTPETTPREESYPGQAAVTAVTHQVSQAGNQVESLIRHHPVTAALASIGLGCIVGMAIRELMAPPTPKHQAMHVLEDIHRRISDLIDPTYDRLSRMTSNSVEALKHGVESVADSKLGSRLKHLFS